MLFQPGIAGVPHDGQQPDSGVATVKTVEEPECPDTGLLRHVLGIVVVARQPACQVVSGVEMRQHDALELRALG